MSKADREKLKRIKEIMQDIMGSWYEFEKNPSDDNAAQSWIDCSLNAQELIEIFEILKEVDNDQ